MFATYVGVLLLDMLICIMCYILKCFLTTEKTQPPSRRVVSIPSELVRLLLIIGQFKLLWITVFYRRPRCDSPTSMLLLKRLKLFAVQTIGLVNVISMI